MANYSGVTAVHPTLTADDVDVVVLSNPFAATATVVNRTGTSEIYFTVNGASPSVGGNDCYVVPAAVCSFSIPLSSTKPVTVQLISSGAMAYSVEGV